MKRQALAIAAVVILLAGGGTLVMVTRSEFLRLIADEVRRQLSALRPDLSETKRSRAAQIVAAMWAHESGYGSTKAFREGWNGGNVSKGSWTGPTISGGDKEYDAAGNVKSITQQWRRYSSLAEAVSDWLRLIMSGRYAKEGAFSALVSGDEGAFVAAIRRAGYFTAAEAPYVASVRSALNGFA